MQQKKFVLVFLEGNTLFSRLDGQKSWALQPQDIFLKD